MDRRTATLEFAIAIDTPDDDAKLDPIVRSFARLAARRHLQRRGYTVLLIPVLLAFIAMLLMAALILGR